MDCVSCRARQLSVLGAPIWLRRWPSPGSLHESPCYGELLQFHAALHRLSHGHVLGSSAQGQEQEA